MCRDASKGRSLSAATKDDATCPETPWYKQRNFYVCLVIVGVLSSETMIRMAQVSQSTSPSSPDSVLEINQVTGLETDHDPKPAFGFYVFGDVPYATWEERMLQDQMDDLTKHRLNHTLFSVHVGDLQRTLVSHCNEEYYHMVRQILRRGPLPTFVVAGDNDWYDCSDRKQGWELFGKYFFRFQKRWKQEAELDKLGISHMQTIHHSDHPELFAFKHASILFLSVHLINGEVGDEPKKDWDDRMTRSIEWVKSNVESYSSNFHIRGVIIFGHSVRSLRTRPFFESIFDCFRGSRAQMPVVYLHGDGHYWGVDSKLSLQLGWKHYRDVQVDQGAFADPILVEIASEDVNGELVPLKVEHANQFLFGKGLIRIDRQRGRYGEDFLMTYGVENGHYKGYSK